MRQRLENLEDVREILRRCKRDYLHDSEDDDDRLRATKIALRRLTPQEQIIFILHTEIGSYRQLAKVFGVSRTTVLNRVKLVTHKLRRQLNADKYDTRTTIHHAHRSIYR